MAKNNTISGFVKPEFEAVREAFIENFERRQARGAACCIYYHGEKVVDLWGGIRNKMTGEPWQQNIMAFVARRKRAHLCSKFGGTVRRSRWNRTCHCPGI